MTTMTFDSMPAPTFTGARALPRASALRLTRRGRLLVLTVALLIAFVVGVFVSTAHSVATDRAGTAAPTRIVRVHDGDTLWQIASGLAHGGDVRTVMATIEQLNAMSSSEVYVGQRLVIPAATRR